MSNSRPLAGRAALVTGASKGIGRAIAEALAVAGADVCVAARSADLLDTVQVGIAQHARAMAIPLDVSDRAACFAAVEKLAAAWGPVDILVTSAAIYKTARFLDTTIADYARLMEVNLHGAINMMQAVLPAMQEKGWGRIVNIASIGGRWGSPNQSAYNVSKHALIGLTRCVALETAKTGVTVNAICPGLVETEMFEALVAGQSEAYGAPPEKMRARILASQPIGRLLAPSEIAGLALYLASPDAGGLTGQAILHDGGTVFG